MHFKVLNGIVHYVKRMFLLSALGDVETVGGFKVALIFFFWAKQYTLANWIMLCWSFSPSSESTVCEGLCI